MKHCKTLISLLLCIGLMLSMVSVFGYNYTYDATAGKVMVNEIGDGVNTFIIIKPDDIEDLTISVIQDNDDVLYKILQSTSVLPYAITIKALNGTTSDDPTDEIFYGKYTLSMNDGTADREFVINIANTTLLDGFLDAIEADSTYQEALALNPFGVPYTGAAKILEASEPSGGYTGVSIANIYNLGEGLSLVADGTITPAEFFSSYEMYLDSDIAQEYASFSSEQKTALDGVAEAACYPEYDANYATDCMLVIAKISAAKNASEVQTVCIDFFEKYDVESDDYNDIKNDYYKSKVFSSILSERKDIDTDVDLIDSFKKHAKKQLKAYKESLNKNDGDASFGGGGFVRVEDPAIDEPVKPSGVFYDLEGHWARANILAMYNRGIINGFTDGSFRPEANVTRAEFVKMLVAALNLEVGGAVNFDDVVPEDWHYAYIATAFNNNIVTGVGTGFNPNGAITRQDASAIVYRAIMAGETAKGTTFADGSEIADYARTAVSALSSKGIILGNDGCFFPKDNMTRAEAATIIQRILQ